MKRLPSSAAFVATLVLLAAHAHTANAAPLGPADPGTAKIGYNSATGDVFISAGGILNWSVGGSQLNAAAAILPPGQNAQPFSRVGQAQYGPMNLVDVNLGPVAVPGLDIANFDGATSPGFSVPEFRSGAVQLPLSGSLGPAAPGQMLFAYDAATGAVVVSISGSFNWYIHYNFGASKVFTGATPNFPSFPPDAGLTGFTDHDGRVGMSILGYPGKLQFTDHYLGRIFPPGRPLSQIAIEYTSQVFSNAVRITAVAIPEPGAALPPPTIRPWLVATAAHASPGRPR